MNIIIETNVVQVFKRFFPAEVEDFLINSSLSEFAKLQVVAKWINCHRDEVNSENIKIQFKK
jgi:hypothetical protein